jgi:hypothetical protein
MKLVTGFFGLCIVALTGCNTAHGGGWLPSADGVAKDKATFGFEYKCDDTSHTLTGTFSYQDHGTGVRVSGKVNEDLDFVACGTSPVDSPPGITGVCGVVTNGGGGAVAGDLVLLGTADGSQVDVTTNNAIVIALYHPSSPLDPEVPISAIDCFLSADSNTFDYYYTNGGNLGGGNITAAKN